MDTFSITLFKAVIGVLILGISNANNIFLGSGPLPHEYSPKSFDVLQQVAPVAVWPMSLVVHSKLTGDDKGTRAIAIQTIS